jgi:hypothetical protein
MITSVGILSFRGISNWNSTLQQGVHYIVMKRIAAPRPFMPL